MAGEERDRAMNRLSDVEISPAIHALALFPHLRPLMLQG